MLIYRIVLFINMLLLSLSAHAGVDGIRAASFYLCCSIGVIVFIILMYSLIKLHQTKRTSFHQHLGIEMFWAIVPFVMLMGLAMPAVFSFFAHV